MADEEPQMTPAEAITAVTRAVVRVEDVHPNSHAAKVLHKQLERIARRFGPDLGLSDDDVTQAILAGGGTPKLPPGDGDG